jgi:hypothetical protein
LERFEETELKAILSDRRINGAEWDRIISVVDEIVIQAAIQDQNRIDLRSIYPSRSEKAKKLLISAVITDHHEAA